jgi:hypothetical protein
MVGVVILAHWFPDVRSPTHAQAGRSGSGDSLTLLDRPETFGRLWECPALCVASPPVRPIEGCCECETRPAAFLRATMAATSKPPDFGRAPPAQGPPHTHRAIASGVAGTGRLLDRCEGGKDREPMSDCRPWNALPDSCEARPCDFAEVGCPSACGQEIAPSHFTVNLSPFASRRAALRFRALRAAKETPALVQLFDIGGRDNVAEFPEPILRAQIYDK